MTRASLITICLAGTGFCGMCVSGLSEPASRVNRRAFIHKIPIAFAAATTASVLQHRLLDCGCPSCNVAMAYERRDVGGDNPSQDMAAMNAQAYETMNRLERSGVKLDTSAEQQASLTAALSEYSYKPTTTDKKEVKAPRRGSRNSEPRTE